MVALWFQHTCLTSSIRLEFIWKGKQYPCWVYIILNRWKFVKTSARQLILLIIISWYPDVAQQHLKSYLYRVSEKSRNGQITAFCVKLFIRKVATFPLSCSTLTLGFTLTMNLEVIWKSSSFFQMLIPIFIADLQIA